MEQSVVSSIDEMIANLETAYTGEQTLVTDADAACTFGCGETL